jgi:transposase InsO family protein
MCDVLEVSRSGFHGWERRAPSDRALSDAWLTSRIIEIHERARGVYGSRRVQAELCLGQGIMVSRKRVRRLMRQAGISGLVKVKRAKTTIRVPGVRVADDLVERQFSPAAPNVLWVADLTYLRTWEGWLYLAAVQDAFSRMIVGWAMAEHMRAELVVDALKMGRTAGALSPVSCITRIWAPNTYHWPSDSKREMPGSRSQWAHAVTPTTTPSPRASSPRSRRSSCTANHGQQDAS